MQVEAIKFAGTAGRWNEMASAYACFSAEQSWEWSEAMGCFGWKSERLIFSSNGRPCGAASVLIRSKYGQFFCYLSRGPLANYGNFEEVSGILMALREFYPKALFIKINPAVLYDEKLFDCICSAGFRKTAKLDLFTETMEIPLSSSEQDLWKMLRPRFRSYLRKSQKILEIRTCRAEEFVTEFESIYQGMSLRKGLGSVPVGFFEKIAEELDPTGMLEMRAAFHEDRMLAGAMILISNRTALYKWGADSRREPALYASHLLHWDNILRAKRMGLAYYDLGGVDSKRNSGVAQFKEGFGGREKRLIGEFDFSGSRVLQKIYDLIRH